MRAAAVLLVTLASAGCGRIGLPRPYPGAEDAAPPEDRAPADAPVARVAPWPIVLRIENVGGRPVPLPGKLAPICDFQLLVRASGGADWWATSATGWDTWCACDACEFRRVRCDFVDFICDDSIQQLAPGAHLDFPWDGLLGVKRTLPPESACTGTCDAWEMVAPGPYVINISTIGGEWETEVFLPPTTGVVVLPVRAE